MNNVVCVDLNVVIDVGKVCYIINFIFNMKFCFFCEYFINLVIEISNFRIIEVVVIFINNLCIC